MHEEGMQTDGRFLVCCSCGANCPPPRGTAVRGMTDCVSRLPRFCTDIYGPAGTVAHLAKAFLAFLGPHTRLTRTTTTEYRIHNGGASVAVLAGAAGCDSQRRYCLSGEHS